MWTIQTSCLFSWMVFVVVAVGGFGSGRSSRSEVGSSWSYQGLKACSGIAWLPGGLSRLTSVLLVTSVVVLTFGGILSKLRRSKKYIKST
ncbi:hypothetical protein FGIG_08922 [Fasciola gigantica]|uniref:Uncharacterized protein n=1 Tax=Fasciola gigantica TaxID=46835 RepID=A0A504YMD4_FASGI|nr:hypothetical protein FGIG_08922 [Fasciola gigantica]